MGGFGGFLESVNPVGGFLGQLGNGLDKGIWDVLSGGALSSADAQAEANAANIGQVNAQMAFQERMSNSAYQRAMADMGKAGLNPMLAFSQGGASTPAGAAGHVDPVNGSLSNVYSKFLDKGMGVLGQKATIDQTQSQADLNNQNVEVGKANIGRADAAADVDVERRQNLAEERENIKQTRRILKNKEISSAAQAKQDVMDTDLSSERYGVDKAMQKPDAIIERIMDALGTAISGKQVFKAPRRRTTTGMDYNKGTGEIYREWKTEDH